MFELSMQTKPTSVSTRSPPLKAAGSTLAPSLEAELVLARRIVDAEHELVAVLLGTALLPSELGRLMLDVEAGSLEPWDVVVGAIPPDQPSKRRALEELRSAATRIAHLEAQRARLRTQRSAERAAHEQSADLEQRSNALWLEMVEVLAETRLASGPVRRASEALEELARAAEDPVQAPPGSAQLRGIEERAGLGRHALKQAAAAARAASRRVTRARNDMVKAYQRLVAAIARKYQGRGLDVVDIIQEGNIGLIRAAEKYDYRQGCRFATYASWWIRSDLQRAIADQSRTIRLPGQIIGKLVRLRRTALETFQDTGARPSPEEVAAQAGISTDEVSMLLQLHNTVSLHTPLGEGRATLEDSLADQDSADVLDGVEARDLDAQLGRALSVLDSRGAHVLRARYGLGSGDGRTLADLGREYGLSRERVRQIEVNALRRVRDSEQADTLRELLD
jgi:RNA polymerase sigma factor (sigma-70 family)